MKTQTAFSLVELMVALSLAAILVMVALPSMRNVLLNNRVTTKTNDFMRALNYARGDALSHSSERTIEPVDSKTWGKGWRVIDTTKASGADDRIISEVTYNDEIAVELQSGPSSLTSLLYNSRGRLVVPTWQGSIIFWICTKNYPQLEGRQVTIRPVGTISIERGSKYACATSNS